jgi:Fe2+ transport system protein FeoA
MLQEALQNAILATRLQVGTPETVLGDRIRGSRLMTKEPQIEGDVWLDEIKAGSVEVVEVVGSNVGRVLAQLGIREGKVLQVRRLAPLGGPILVECGGSAVAVGRGMARKVRVRVLP